ncbi:hypothetical protein H4219_002953 [Mycoemilia scoparia]|uniref:Myb-like domain-containing protein n=1 Tax=Mycoemilia scoparia TaxID=417184 RepID=A0A9W7ZWW9_9FUNG|nr:hypothetical protein H4219_002953 [Mycoemilia scoparia]
MNPVKKDSQIIPFKLALARNPCLKYQRFYNLGKDMLYTAFEDVQNSCLMRGLNGNPLCLYCGKETNSPDMIFCESLDKLGCVHELRLRQGSHYVRQCLLKRDSGICRYCKIDAHRIFELSLRCKSLGQKRGFMYILNSHDPGWGTSMKKVYKDNFSAFTEGMFWEAAHVIDVKMGGGVCGLYNYITLCIPCHRKETKRRGTFTAAMLNTMVVDTKIDEFLHGNFNLELWRDMRFVESPQQCFDLDPYTPPDSSDEEHSHAHKNMTQNLRASRYFSLHNSSNASKQDPKSLLDKLELFVNEPVTGEYGPHASPYKTPTYINRTSPMSTQKISYAKYISAEALMMMSSNTKTLKGSRHGMREWTLNDDVKLTGAVNRYGKEWDQISNRVFDGQWTPSELALAFEALQGAVKSEHGAPSPDKALSPCTPVRKNATHKHTQSSLKLKRLTFSYSPTSSPVKHNTFQAVLVTPPRNTPENSKKESTKHSDMKQQSQESPTRNNRRGHESYVSTLLDF